VTSFFTPAPDLGTALPRLQDVPSIEPRQPASSGIYGSVNAKGLPDYRRVVCDCGCGRWTYQRRKGRPLRFLTRDCWRKHRRGQQGPRADCRCESCRFQIVVGRTP
jgi:hypothetical protein